MKSICCYRECDIEFELTPTQEGIYKKGNRVFCHPQHNTYEYQERCKDERKEKNKNLGKIQCNLIGCEIWFKPISTRHKYCCIKHGQTANWKNLQKSKRDYYRRNKKLYTKKDEPKTSGRKCKMCGKDPYPNYYFCPPCHTKLPENDSDDWHNLSIGG